MTFAAQETMMEATREYAAAKKDDAAFMQGIALVVAEVARSGHETQAASLLSGFGLARQDFHRKEIAQYDLVQIGRLYRTEAQLGAR